MYKILKVEDKIRVPPSKFDLGVEEAVKLSLEEKWEGKIERDTGVVLSIVSIKDIGGGDLEGRIIPGDGAIYYP
ncbi:MAG: DNA-directed RNA polymerase, partial [Candidatus Aenigmatarchaeota archaeon]